MNSLLRAIAQVASSSSLSSPFTRKRDVLDPIFVIVNSYSLFSTTATTSRRWPLKSPQKSPPPPPSPAPAKTDGGSEWPRPSEIPWQVKVANSVNLIGYVHMPVQFQTAPDGKYWAGTVIGQDADSSTDSPSLWIPIIFEGDLAHIAACHLKENDCVYITGQLSADPPSFTANHGQANVQVMVRSINFVQESQIKKSFTPRKQEQWTLNCSANVKDDIYVNQSWKDLLTKPHEWWDIRLKVGDPAAFERKDNGELLQTDECTPKWIQQQLESITFDHKMVLKSQKKVGTNLTASTKIDGDSALSSWKDLLDNPKHWLDYREKKRSGLVNPKHPDFKRKDGGLSLWLNRAPHWVLSKLENVQFDVQIHNSKQKDQRDEYWKDLVENPDKWWDNRSGKMKERSPDFKHKETGEGLWLSSSPTWVLAKLPPVKGKQDVAIGKRDTLLS